MYRVIVITVNNGYLKNGSFTQWDISVCIEFTQHYLGDLYSYWVECTQYNGEIE